MRNLVVCCDGTWNTPDEMQGGVPSPTNVAKLRNALVEDGDQLVYYHSGVGTGKGWWDHVVGGGAGAGLDDNTKGAYAWLAKTYRPDDKIYLFGFSRGAYTARCCAGLIARYGLLDLSAVDAATGWTRVGELFAALRGRVDPFANAGGYPFFNQKPGQSQKGTTLICCIGVWDTVGALGIPDDFALLGLIDNASKYGFYDTALSEFVAHARHAVGLDERRASFAPTMWTEIPDGVDAKQLWFPGVHCDVGGGYPETGLSDGSLAWMMNETKLAPGKAWGLRFHDGVESQLKPDPLGILHDSCTGLFDFLKSRPRSVPFLAPDQPDILHPSVDARLATVPLSQGRYWSATKLAPGASRTVEVFARQRWNRTGLYLEAGVEYAFAASGEWIDGDEPFTPDGRDGGFRFGDIVRMTAGLLDKLEPFYGKLSGEKNVDFWYTRRVGTAPWMALIGFVANNAMAPNSTPNDLPIGQTFEIGVSETFTPAFGGYLYAFANDTWQTYANNRGSVMLTVSRARDAA